MRGLTQRFVDLKTGIGGNREKQAFEFTFGMPSELLRHITMPPAHVRRILSEVQFALEMVAHAEDESKPGFSRAVDSALSVLEIGMRKEGAVSIATAMEAERTLLPMSEATREYEVLCVGHAHIDMNWMWGYQETVASTLATFRTMLNLMKEYPEFTFAQSQASVYRIVEEYDPDMMDEIRERIREGRWEVTATNWVECDKNMPDTESLIRHIQMTHDYMESVWGVPRESLTIDFSPDTFGHSAFVPEIDRACGVKYMYHCRGITTNDVLYRYRSPGGAELLVYREPYWYNSGITHDAGTGIIGLSKASGGLKTGLIVYGVGNHGGGVTRRDVERILEMQAWPVFPRLRFGTFAEYFQKAEAVRAALPVQEKELNAIFTGCYSTQSRIKRGNRRCEAALLDAETLMAIAGQEMPKKLTEKAWRNVLFTHFHDILTGSCVQETREHAMGLYAEAMAAANTCASKAVTLMGERLDTSCFLLRDEEGSQSEGAGAGYGIEAYAGVPNPERGRGRARVYAIYNPTDMRRDEVVELTLWDWPFDLRRLWVRDAQHRPVPFALLTHEAEWYWDHRKLRLLVRVSMEPFGYTTVCVDEKEAEAYPTYRLSDERVENPFGDLVLENENLRAVFSGHNGDLLSLVDKADGREVLTDQSHGRVALIRTEGASSDAWHIGRWLEVQELQETVSIKPFENALEQGFEMVRHVLSSTVTERISLRAGSSVIRHDLKIDWNEACQSPQQNVPVLAYLLPCGGDSMRMDVPGGVVDRHATGQDLPALSFAASVHGKRAVCLAADCKYGYRLSENVLSLTLIQTARYPDPYPERGVHTITLWVGVSDGEKKSLRDLARGLNHPPVPCSTGIHTGSLSPNGSLLTIHAESSVLSSMFRQGDRLILRMQELDGREDTVRVQVSHVREADLTDLTDTILCHVPFDSEGVRFTMPPFGLRQLVLKDEAITDA